ncbi:sigma-70 family RNA polymerase sigma factor [Mycoplasmatota bacterium]|nr:sigma-70 family RNA polymerase sigma factor [Mycoplasmatota bacterium]
MVDQNVTNLFNDIYDSTNRKVLIYITTKCNNTADISDIFQETYMELYSVLIKRGVNYIKNYEAFVLKIAKQKIYRYYSILDRLKMMVSLSEKDKAFNITDLKADSFMIEDTICEKDLVEQVNEFLSKKSEDVKKIFYLFYYFNLSIREIAKLLRLNESNVKNKLYRTLKELRERWSIN